MEQFGLSLRGGVGVRGQAGWAERSAYFSLVQACALGAYVFVGVESAALVAAVR